MNVKQLRKDLKRLERLNMAGLQLRFTNGSGTIYQIKTGPYLDDPADVVWVDLEPVPLAVQVSKDHRDYLEFEGERPDEITYPAEASTWDHGLATWLAAMQHARDTL